MLVPSRPENRSSYRLTATCAVAVILLATLPALADGEHLALLRPSTAVAPTGDSDPGLSVERFSSDREPAETATAPIPTDPGLVKVSLVRVDNQESITLQLPADGRLGPDEARDLEHFLRCRRTGKHRTIDAGVLALLADVAAHWPDRSIQIVSGFRSPPYGVPHSKHFKGHAIDLRIPGVRTTVLRDYVWGNHHGVGVGYYKRENFVHMDSRPETVDMAWTGSEEGGPELLNPRWARKARKVPPIPTPTPEAQPVSYAQGNVCGTG
jgi:uncharacterized protein YcbK (DUF882 family)